MKPRSTPDGEVGDNGGGGGYDGGLHLKNYGATLGTSKASVNILYILQ